VRTPGEVSFAPSAGTTDGVPVAAARAPEECDPAAAAAATVAVAVAVT
jgi:hypothetical protein